MTRSLVIALIAAVGLAAPASAATSLAQQLGVDDGVLSRSELVLLKSAIDNDDRATVRALRARAEAQAPTDLVLIGYSDKSPTPQRGQ